VQSKPAGAQGVALHSRGAFSLSRKRPHQTCIRKEPTNLVDAFAIRSPGEAAIVGLGLLFVAVQAINGRQGTEQAMLFVLNASGKKERCGGPGSLVADVVVAEGEGPKSIDGQ
jgi:hypothetical protein